MSAPALGSRRRAGWLVQSAVAVVAGAALWGAWLGWDRTSSYDVVTGTVQHPYVTLQVLGCALTVGLTTGALAARWSPVLVAVGVSAGFLLCWTAQAASTDSTGLYLVGAVLLALGLALGTGLSAAVGHLVGRLRVSADEEAP